MKKAEKFWDFISKKYDDEPDNPADRKDFEITKKYLHISDNVLDYACGTGTLSIEIADQVKAIHALDISSKMLAAAERKAAERKFENIHFAQTTIFDERYQKESFDVVMAFNILHLLEDARGAVQRINELLKPGSFFISTTPCRGEKKALSNSLLFLLVRVPSKMGIIPYARLFETSELEDLLAHGNFQIVETKIFSDQISNFFRTSDYFIVAKKLDRG